MNFTNLPFTIPLRQIEMQEAQYRQNIYPYYNPFIIEDEVYRRISDYDKTIDPRYWISQYGNVYDEVDNCRLALSINTGGYLTCTLKLNPKYDVDHVIRAKMTVHRLVCKVFIGPPPQDNYVINHINCNTVDPRAENLEWVTQQQNIRHSLALGHYGEGETYVSAKRSEAEIRAVCELLQSGVTDIHDISRRVFNCELTSSISSLIRDIRNGSGWTSVTKDYNIPEIEHRSFTNDEVIHAFCRFLETHPEAVHDTKTYTASYILYMMRLERYIQSPDDKRKYASILTQLRKRTAYTKISSQYNIQW